MRILTWILGVAAFSSSVAAQPAAESPKPRQRFFITGDLHLSPGVAVAAEEARRAIDKMVWTLDGMQGADGALNKLQFKDMSPAGGDFVAAVALANYGAARSSNGFLLRDTAKQIAETEMDGDGAIDKRDQRYFDRRFEDEPVAVSAAQREAACSIAIRKVIDAKVAPFSVRECETASLSPSESYLPIQTFPAFPTQDLDASSPRISTRVHYFGESAVQLIDLMSLDESPDLDFGQASEQVRFARFMALTSGDRLFVSALNGYEQLRLEEGEALMKLELATIMAGRKSRTFHFQRFDFAAVRDAARESESILRAEAKVKLCAEEIRNVAEAGEVGKPVLACTPPPSPKHTKR